MNQNPLSETQPNASLEQSGTQVSPLIPTSTNWSKVLLLVVLGLIIVAGAAYAGFYIGKKQILNEDPIVAQPTSIPISTKPAAMTTPTPVPETDPTTDWKTYQIAQLSMEFKMSELLNPSEELDFTTSHGDMSWNNSPDKSISLSSTSTKSTFEGGFSYLNGCIGYKKSGVGYKFLTYTNGEIDMSNQFTEEVINQNQVRYLIVKSDPNQVIEGMPPIGITQRGFIAAIVNTNDINYPAVVIKMKITSSNSEEVFKEVLSTLNITN